jgi:hypothetical protein
MTAAASAQTASAVNAPRKALPAGWAATMAAPAIVDSIADPGGAA